MICKRRNQACRKEMVGPSRSNHKSFGISGWALVGSPQWRDRGTAGDQHPSLPVRRAAPLHRIVDVPPALVGIVRRFGALFQDAGDHEFAGLEAAFPGHGGQFVTE